MEQLSLDRVAPMQMTAEQEVVYRKLHQHSGKENAIRIKDLAAATRIHERKLREVVTSLILIYNVRIGSCYSGKHAGYYLIESAEEAEETYKVLYHHAISILRRAAIIKKLSFPELVGQLLLEK